MIEKYGWQGTWMVRAIDKPTGKIKLAEVIHNRIMNNALDEIIKAFYDSPPDMELAYVAIGDDNTAVADAQTTLVNEVFRSAVVSLERTAAGEVTSLAIILDSDYAGAIEEIGMFAGSTASATADTGLMISRILWSYTKTATEEIQFTRIDKLIRA